MKWPELHWCFDLEHHCHHTSEEDASFHPDLIVDAGPVLLNCLQLELNNVLVNTSILQWQSANMKNQIKRT
jgi:hypothetical protein